MIAEDGGYFTFKFKVPLTVVSIGLLNNVEGVEFEITLVDGQTIILDHKDRGKNSFEEVEIGIPLAMKMKVKVFGPTAITHLELTNALMTCNK